MTNLITDIKFKNVIQEILREIQRCPNDSIQDIANEILKKWDCGFHLTHSLTYEGDNEN